MKTLRLAPASVTKLQDVIKKINRRARRLGLDEMMVVLGEREPKSLTFERPDGTHFTVMTHVRNVQVVGEIPFLPGWRINAVRDRESSTGIVTWHHVHPEVGVGGLPESDLCDHCNTRRERKRLYHLEHESGERMIVGTSCVRDFTGGIDPRQVALAAQWQWISEMMQEGEDWFAEESGDWTRPSRDNFDLRFFVAMCAKQIEEHGYQKRDDTKLATADIVQEEYWSMGWVAIEEAARSHIEVADQIIEFIKSSDGDSTYWVNLKNAISAECITLRHVGLVASGVGMFYRDRERKAESQAMEALPYIDEYFGNPRERKEASVTITFKKVIYGHYGDSILYKFRTDAGHALAWFCSGRGLRNEDGSACEVGDTLNIVGTVKRHSIYEDKRETLINRVRVK